MSRRTRGGNVTIRQDHADPDLADVAMSPGADDAQTIPRRSEPSWAWEVWRAMGERALRAVLVGVILAFGLAALGGLSVLSGPTTYQSTAVMLINDPYKLATAGQPNEFGSLDVLRYKYSALVRTNAIAGPVAAGMGLPVGEVIGALSTEVPTNSLLMNVTSTWSQPGVAQKLAQAAADEVTTYINQEDDAYHIPAADRFAFQVIDAASPATAQGPSTARAVTLAIGLAVLGFAIGFVVTQLVRILRPR